MAKLYFYYSAMNAGKTTTLLQSAHNYRERGMRVAILSPRLDHRAGSGRVASRIGLSAAAVGFDAGDDLLAWATADIPTTGRRDRSEGGRAGKGGCHKCRIRWAAYPTKKKQTKPN